jgi:hypothetical protein
VNQKERAAQDLAARLSAASDQDQTLTEELWRHLTTGDPLEVDPHSLAAPPNWKP